MRGGTVHAGMCTRFDCMHTVSTIQSLEPCTTMLWVNGEEEEMGGWRIMGLVYLGSEDRP
jgi:hypothetical protein